MSPPLVYLVGAGPGDPGLLTLAGADALRNAAVVVYDYLANPELLALAPASAERIYVGKSAGRHTLTQDEINALLLAKARADSATPGETRRIIVRLKGGDPYVFGRGGEEAAFLRENGVPVIIVPGITAGIAAPAYAGIPVTHRDFATSVTFVTGHEKEDAPDDSARVDFSALAALLRAGGTLIFYMGVKSLPGIVEKLLRFDAPADLPAAVIRWGTRPDQQTVTAPLADLPAAVAAAKLAAPAITIVGKVVSLRPTLSFFETRPLFGQTVLVTRTRQQASSLARGLAELGALVLEAPTIDVAPPAEEDLAAIDDALLHLPAYDWIVFTSANGVRAAVQRLRELSFDARHFAASSIAAVGPATADALREIGLHPDLLPERNLSTDLADILLNRLREDDAPIAAARILLLRADIAGAELPHALRHAGAHVTDVPVYRTRPAASLPPEVLAAIENSQVTWTTFTSASTAANLWALLPEPLRQRIAAAKRASIGPQTSAALRALGSGEWAPTVEAAPHTIEALLHALSTSPDLTASTG